MPKTSTLLKSPTPLGEREIDLRIKEAEAALKKLERALNEAALKAVQVTPATAFEGRTARGNLGWWWLRVRGRHGP
jgi:hypothetical protein